MVRTMRPEKRLSLDESLECLAGAMKPHFDRVRANRKGQSGLVGIQLLDIAEQEDRSIFLGKSLDAAPHHLTRVATLENCLSGVGPGRWVIDPLAVVIEARQ